MLIERILENVKVFLVLFCEVFEELWVDRVRVLEIDLFFYLIFFICIYDIKRF